MDINLKHEFLPNKQGKCKQIVGGKRSGYRICGEEKDFPAHQRWEEDYILLEERRRNEKV
ncbi:hypothetical protein KO465_04940 [Candidatus Micrarchaeota archaeon]|nr:hypothetical protein [Candidatus Micrarchaeota archaeon]